MAQVDVVMKNQTGGLEVQTSMHRIGGSANDGLWEGTVPFQPCHSKAGTWTARVEVYDEAGLGRIYYDPPSMNLAMDANDHSRPVVVDLRRSPPAAGPVVATFSEDVQGITAETMQVRPKSSRSTPVAGRLDRLDETRTPTDCRAGPVRIARFVPDARLHVITYELVINPPGTLGVTDMSGNPAQRVLEFRPR